MLPNQLRLCFIRHVFKRIGKLVVNKYDLHAGFRACIDHLMNGAANLTVAHQANTRRFRIIAVLLLFGSC